MKMAKYNVIIPAGMRPYPENHEISAAILLAKHFEADVLFIERIANSKSADVSIKGLIWEIKSPIGKGKHNIQHALKYALKQSGYIVFDARRSRIHAARIKSELQRQYAFTPSMKRLLLIQKTGEIIEFSKQNC